MNKQKKAFTLVELIVVITILAILGTIAFISLQGYSQDSRDAVRISDISRIKTSVELFQLGSGKYPLPTDITEITYSGTLAWSQGLFGEDTFKNVTNLDKIPLDPSTDKQYVYSVINTRQEYQLAGIIEGEVVYNPSPLTPLLWSRGEEVQAAQKTAVLKISGTYNGKILKVSTGGIDYVLAIPSIITSTGLTVEEIANNDYFAYNGYKNLPAQYAGGSYSLLGDEGLNLVDGSKILVYSGSMTTLSSTKQDGIDARKQMITNLKSAYAGSQISHIGEISEILSLDIQNTDDTEKLSSTIVSNNLGGSIVTSDGGLNDGELDGGGETTPTEIVTQSICTSAGWYWVDDDMYIGTNKGPGFCISPIIMYNGDVSDKGISWNGWGYRSDLSQCNGWEADGVNDDGSADNDQGQTRTLQVADGSSLPKDYVCKPLGTALGDITLSDNSDSTNSSDDTIENRMRWLVKYKQNRTAFQNIDWIDAGTLLRNNIVPSLFLADCIDGIRDLGTGKNLIYKHKDGTTQEITYSQYSENITTEVGNTAVLDNVTYQNRQKYLTAWTQKSGSHLPSAFSYISTGSSGGCDSGACSTLSVTGKGEYQVACEAGDIQDSTSTIIKLSAIGTVDGKYVGRDARQNTNCLPTRAGYAGSDRGTEPARFVVRP